jgi:hypothetical protein
MSKSDNVFLQVPVRYEGEVRKLIQRLTRKPKSIDRKTSYSQYDLTVAMKQARSLQGLHKKLCREYNRLEDLYEKNLTSADQQWVGTCMSELRKVLDKIDDVNDY